LLDLGGGSGAFAIETVKRYPGMSAVVLDLPDVITVTERIIAEADLVDKIACVGGDLRSAPWPPGADAILLSYIVSCYSPETLRDLMARTFDYLPSSGRLLLHDFALHADRSGPHNAALFLFGQLSGVAETTAYTVDELAAAMRAAGYVDVASQPFLPDITFLVTGRKP
jgi:cyclopropane fatty-acyl-phospholipid synthase-like methyltransferase